MMFLYILLQGSQFAKTCHILSNENYLRNRTIKSEQGDSSLGHLGPQKPALCFLQYAAKIVLIAHICHQGWF